MIVPEVMADDLIVVESKVSDEIGICNSHAQFFLCGMAFYYSCNFADDLEIGIKIPIAGKYRQRQTLTGSEFQANGNWHRFGDY